MNNTVTAILLFGSFLVNGCATITVSPKIAIEKKEQDKVILYAQDENLLMNKDRQVNFEFTTSKEKASYCIDVVSSGGKIAVYKKIISVVTLSLYPYQTSQVDLVQIKDCKDKSKILYSNEIEKKNYAGVGMLFYPGLTADNNPYQQVLESTIEYGVQRITAKSKK